MWAMLFSQELLSSRFFSIHFGMTEETLDERWYRVHLGPVRIQSWNRTCGTDGDIFCNRTVLKQAVVVWFLHGPTFKRGKQRETWRAQRWSVVQIGRGLVSLTNGKHFFIVKKNGLGDHTRRAGTGSIKRECGLLWQKGSLKNCHSCQIYVPRVRPSPRISSSRRRSRSWAWGRRRRGPWGRTWPPRGGRRVSCRGRWSRGRRWPPRRGPPIEKRPEIRQRSNKPTQKQIRNRNTEDLRTVLSNDGEIRTLSIIVMLI